MDVSRGDSGCVCIEDAATTRIYPLSLPDALPIWHHRQRDAQPARAALARVLLGVVRAPQEEGDAAGSDDAVERDRSEEHTSELQSRQYLVCRLLLEKKSPQPPRSCLVPHRRHPCL